MKKGITLSGDWKAFKKFLSLKWLPEMETLIDKVTGDAAEMIRAEIVTRIKDKEYESNALATALRKGFKSQDESIPLIHTGRMIREALLSKKVKTWIWQVGILGNIQASGKSGLSLFDVVPILHDGGTVQTNGVTIRIPPRPFLSNVFEDPKIIKKVNKMWEQAIEKILKKHGKL